MRKYLVASVLGTYVLFCPTVSSAAVINLTPADNWLSILNSSTSLNPGDEVILAEGVYSHSTRLSFGNVGTAENPIIIRAADGAKVVITRPSASQNVMDIEGAQYVTFRGLEITGGSRAIRIRGRSGRNPIGLTFEDMYIHDVDAGAFSANDPGFIYDGLVFRRNHIRNIGGDAAYYLGCNNRSSGATDCVFRNGLVEGNYIHDLGGGVGDGIQIKDGSYNNIIRDNVIHSTGVGGSVGILVYGTDGNAPNIIERNVIWNAGDEGIQAASEAIIRNNIIFNPAFDGIFGGNHQSAVLGNLTIVNNTVISKNDAIAYYSSSGGLSGPILIANNAFYTTDSNDLAMRLPNVSGITVAGNVGQGGVTPSQSLSAWQPSGDINQDFADIASMIAFPVAGSALIGAGDPTYMTAVDFNGTPRAGTNDAGAYVYDPNGNPGWMITSDFKPPIEVPEPATLGLMSIALIFMVRFFGTRRSVS